MSEKARRVIDRRTLDELLAAHLLRKQSHGKQGRFPDFSDMVLRDVDVSGWDFIEAHFQDSLLERCRFVGTNLGCTEFGGAVAVDCDFSHAVLAKANLDEGDFRGCLFDGANMIRAFLHTSDLRGASFRSADLRGAVFMHCDLRDAVFDAADLNGARFINCRAEGMTWMGATTSPDFRTDPRSKPLAERSQFPDG